MHFISAPVNVFLCPSGWSWQHLFSCFVLVVALSFFVNSFLAAAAGARRAKLTDRAALSALYLRGSPLGVKLRVKWTACKKGFMRLRKSVCACRPQRCFAADSEAQYSTESPMGFSSSYLQQWFISAQRKFVCCLMKFSCGCSLSSGRLRFFLRKLIEIHHRKSWDMKTWSLSFSGLKILQCLGST